MPAEPLDRRARGDAVETAALHHLQAHGLQLLARNAQSRGGELDLVMRDASIVRGPRLQLAHASRQCTLLGVSQRHTRYGNES